MKYNLKTYFAASALLLCGALTGCTSDDDFGRIPEGGIPLSIGRVGVAGVETATRAAVTENASGFTGIRKTTFVNGDALTLVMSNDGGTTTTNVTATLTGGAWVLNPAKNFVIPGTTTIQATYTPTATAGMKADVLEAAYTMDGQKVTFAMKHVNAMIDITYTAGVAPASISVTANNGTSDESLSTAVEEEADASKHFRTIVSPGTVKSLTAVINGQNYVATLATPLAVAANKRYPIALTFKENVLTATVGAATLNWNIGGTGEVLPTAYDRLIGTPEDLAQFAYDVNNNLNGARTAKVLQTADIDLAQLKTAADANTANPGKNYTYTATAANWVPIADSNYGDADSFAFSGTYNGNAYTVKNMKINSNSSTGAGFFTCVNGATLTGIHLRGVLINFPSGTQKDCAALCVYAVSTTISLCSATGDITYCGKGNTTFASSGGLIGVALDTAVTRCSCNVNINANEPQAYQYVGGFVGCTEGTTTIAGCSYDGNMTFSGSGAEYMFKVGGFVGKVGLGNHVFFGCGSKGTIVSGQSFAFTGIGTSGVVVSFISCYSTIINVSGFSGVSSTFADCAWTGTQSITGITSSVAVADLYEKITASGASTPAVVKTLHWSVADGYTTTEVSDTWYASSVWKDNGTAAPTVDMTYEGGAPLYNGQPANLLALSGQEAYWVAPVNAATKVAWTAIDFTTVCPAGWHVPTSNEFNAMLGGGTVTWDSGSPLFIAVTAAFPFDQVIGGIYWSSTDDGLNPTDAFIMVVQSDLLMPYYYQLKTELANVRCVRKK